MIGTVTEQVSSRRTWRLGGGFIKYTSKSTLSYDGDTRYTCMEKQSREKNLGTRQPLCREGPSFSFSFSSSCQLRLPGFGQCLMCPPYRSQGSEGHRGQHGEGRY